MPSTSRAGAWRNGKRPSRGHNAQNSDISRIHSAIDLQGWGLAKWEEARGPDGMALQSGDRGNAKLVHFYAIVLPKICIFELVMHPLDANIEINSHRFSFTGPFKTSGRLQTTKIMIKAKICSAVPALEKTMAQNYVTSRINSAIDIQGGAWRNAENKHSRGKLGRPSLSSANTFDNGNCD